MKEVKQGGGLAVKRLGGPALGPCFKFVKKFDCLFSSAEFGLKTSIFCAGVLVKLFSLAPPSPEESSLYLLGFTPRGVPLDRLYAIPSLLHPLDQ